jgi:cytochrome c-type biogenesis protein CcmH/NrfG
LAIFASDGRLAITIRIFIAKSALLGVFLAGPLALNLFAQTSAPLISTKSIADELAQGDFASAMTHSSTLLKVHPRDSALWTLKGIALARLKNTAEALQAFDRALSIDPTFVPALRAEAQTAYRVHHPSTKKCLDRLLAVQPDDTVALAMRGALAFEEKQCDQAIEFYRRSGPAVLTSESSITQYASCLVSSNRAEEARTLLLQGINRYPENTVIRYDLAVAQSRLHRASEVIAALAPLQNSDDAGVLNLIASAYAETGQRDAAASALSRAIQLRPKEEDNYLDLAILSLENASEARSIEIATQGLAQLPQSSRLFLIRGVAEAQLAHYDNAEGDFATASQLAPDQPNSTIAMSFLLSDKNRPAEQEALLRSQQERTPNDAVVNYLLADLILRRGAKPGEQRYAEAQSALDRSLSKQPQSAEAQILAGKIDMQLNEFEHALIHFDEAYKVDPNNRAALSFKLQALRKLHRNEQLAEVVGQLRSIVERDLASQGGPSTKSMQIKNTSH